MSEEEQNNFFVFPELNGEESEVSSQGKNSIELIEEAEDKNCDDEKSKKRKKRKKREKDEDQQEFNDLKIDEDENEDEDGDKNYDEFKNCSHNVIGDDSLEKTGQIHIGE